MNPSGKNLRICSNGHRYFKSSDCPVCPVCEKKKEPEGSFLSKVAAPARRALERAGIKTVEDLARYSEAQLLSLHGMGPGSIPKLRDVLKEAGLSFDDV